MSPSHGQAPVISHIVAAAKKRHAVRRNRGAKISHGYSAGLTLYLSVSSNIAFSTLTVRDKLYHYVTGRKRGKA
jgi:hypothetical protein